MPALPGQGGHRKTLNQVTDVKAYETVSRSGQLPVRERVVRQVILGFPAEAGMLTAEGVAKLVTAVPVAVGAIEVPAPCRRAGRAGCDGAGISGRGDPGGASPH